MTSKKIPVSYEFFKKYTNHEECVSVMLKLKANGNKEAYEALLKRKDCKEKALRSYYEAFYLKPKIREKYHICIKPVPKKIKDKLLVIPVQDTENISETGTPGEDNKVIDVIQEVINGIDNNSKSNNELEASHSNSAKKEEPKRRILMSAKYVCDGDYHEVEDDNEPLSSPDISSSSKQISAKINSPGQENKVPVASSSKTLNSTEINSKQSNGNISSIENKESDNSKASSSKPSNDKQTGLMANNNNKPANPNTGSKDESVHLKADFNYKALVPYIHCCPLTLKEFRKYSNISQLIAELCENKHRTEFQQRLVVQNSYLLFYLAPEYRTITPINKIQLAANSPAHIKNIFFNIPTNLYLKNDLNKSQVQNLPESTNNATNNAILPITNSSVTEPVIEQNKNEAPQDTATNDVNQKATMPEAVNNCNEQDNNVTQQSSISLLTDHTAGPIVKMPVSLDEFKKYTNHEEIVDKLFKIKAQDNIELYYKYKNSQEAFDSTLRNYYRSFYLSPIIRETYPIRFKPLPNSLKNRLKEIPEGVVKSTSLNSIRIEELVSLEFNLPVVSNKGEEICAAQHHNAVKNINHFSTSPTKDNQSSGSDNKTKSPTNTGATKRATTEDMKSQSPSPKRQKSKQSQDSTENKERTTKIYKELLPYAHCCPVTFSEFRKYTNVTELFRGYCHKLYKSLHKLPYMLQRAYVLYYLAPENRNHTPLNKLKTLHECPIDLRSKIFEIPRNIYLKGENTDNVQTQENIETQIEKGVTQNQNLTQDLTAETTGVKPTSSKSIVEILENRLLPPITLPLTENSNAESQCPDTNCVFHHITQLDFVQHTNILHILPEPHDSSVIRNIFKKCIYQIVKEKSCDGKYGWQIWDTYN